MSAIREKTMREFAAEIDVAPNTVGDIVEKRELDHRVVGRCKMLPPATQRAIRRILNINPAQHAAAS